MTSFRDKLKEIRQEERSERIPLTDEELGLNDGSELYLKARDDLARYIEQLMLDFTSETPSFHVHHGFFEALQGNRPTGAILIASIGPDQVRWEYGTDGAMTLIPLCRSRLRLSCTTGL